MRRGEVVWVELGDPIGSEARGRRPAVIVSNDAANEAVEVLGNGVVTVVPTTTDIRKIQPYQVLLPGDERSLWATGQARRATRY